MGNLTKTNLQSLLDSKSLPKRFETMRTLDVKRDNIKQVLTESDKIGKDDLNLTCQAILMRSKSGDHEEAFELASWSLQAKQESRKTIVSGFIKNKQSSFFVHQIARQKRADAATLMTDYFEQGGEMKDVAEWLSVAGSILKTGRVPDETDGWGWLGDVADSIIDGVVGAINTVADAINAAGKNLANAIQEVVNWSQDKISDFVEAIIRAGHKVADILNEALKKSALGKFIQAIIDAGKKGLEILDWAYNKASDVLRSTLQKLEQIYNSFTTLLMEIAKMMTARLAPIIKELLNIGKKVVDFLSRLDRIADHIAKLIVQEIKNAGKTIKDIMTSLVNLSRHIARIVIDALKSLNVAINAMLKEVINWTADQLSILIGALKDLGITLSQVLDEIAKFIGAQLIKLMTAVRLIWKVLKELLEFIATKTESVIHTLLVALMGTVIHIGNVLEVILNEVRAAFKNGLIKGLMAMGYSALVLLKEAVKISAAAALVFFGILLDILGKHRGLLPEERVEAEKVFGTSINLDMVKMTDASFPADLLMYINKNRPFTTMYVINYKSGTNLPLDTVIHELTHIWQAVNSGGVYMIEALHSQFFGEGYKLTDTDVINAKGQLLNLEREQQAVLVEEYWKGEFRGRSIPLSLDLIRPLAKQVYKANPQKIAPINLRDLDINIFRVAPIS